ncbi:MAG TPA: DUF4942 domain-containing protein [Tenuifilaceae bacterium]|nr:DUF4942 domain-containing protein [Tenuifilaceae bacterium]
MFGKNFYPTPQNLLETVLSNINIKDKIILEPSAGSGNIIEYLNKREAKEILCCEINVELARICSQKAHLIERDFFNLKAEQVSHIDIIVMNPPFDADEKHILHAFDIAPEGCEIYAFCNFNTYRNPCNSWRKNLQNLINENGTITNLENAFAFADRQTNADIGFIQLFKPKSSSENEFDGYFDLSEEPEEKQENGLMTHNDIREIVNRYVAAVKMFDSVNEINIKINDLIGPINSRDKLTFGAFIEDSHRDLRKIDRDRFKKELQKSAWATIFSKMEMRNAVTSSVIEEINKFVELQSNVPFTMRNIFLMLDMIVGTKKSRMEKVIVEAFDKITSHHYDNNNRFIKEGWKTNSEYIVNKKFILPRIVEKNFSGEMRSSIYDRYTMDDIHKALCFVTGRKYEDSDSFQKFFYRQVYRDGSKGRILTEEEVLERKSTNKYMHEETVYDLEFGKLYEWGFFKFRGYMKGSIHCEFKDENVWKEFNHIAAKAKGFQLASKFTSDFRVKSNEVTIFRPSIAV